MSIGPTRPEVADPLPPSPEQLARQTAAETHRARQDRQDRAVLAGGETITVHWRGGAAPREVMVRLLPVIEYQAFLNAQSDEATLVMLVAGLSTDEVAQLAPASHADLVEAANALNFTWAIAWSLRRQAVADRFALLDPAAA